MATRELERADVLDRLHGCWMGQQIGATLGTPLDGRSVPANLRFYDPVPGQATASQEIDFQLAWLNLLRVHGAQVSSDELAEQWRKHIAYTYDELGWAEWNLRRGLLPPLSGAFNNWFKDGSAGMGRALFWSMMAPGAPQTAAELAWQDAILDHASEGLWAAMFWAAAGSAAFVIRDVPELLEIGLAMVPSTCRTAGAVRAARDRFRLSQTPLQIREAILNVAQTDNYTDAAQNSGLIAMGLLHGKGDFGATVTTAVNGGLNARVNGLLTGGIAGILRGRIGIPAEWADPIGEVLIYGWGLRDLEVERTTGDLAAATLEAAAAMIAERSADVAIVDGASIETPVTPPAPAPEEPAPARPAAPESAEPSLVGDRARFLEFEPATESPAASAAPPDADDAETEAPRPAPDAHVAPPAERAEISDTATVAAPLPSDAPVAATPEATPESADSEAGAAPAAVEPMPSPEGETAAIASPTEGAAITEPTAAPAPANDSTGSSELADIFQPSADIGVTSVYSNSATLRNNDRAKELLVRPSSTAVCEVADFEFTIDYGANGPVLLPGAATNFTVAVRNTSEADFVGGISLSTPPGWQVAVPGAQSQRQMIAAGRMARFGFVVRAPEEAQLTGVNRVQVVLSPANATPIVCDLTFLGGSCWWITGPFANRDEEGYDKVFEVEDRPGRENQYLGRGGGMVGWQRIAFRENVMSELEPFFGGFGGVAYATTSLHFSMQTDARIVIHSNDGVHIWLNGQRIFRRHAHESFRPEVSQSRNMVDVTFKPGVNQLMLKIVRCKEPLQFAFLVTDRHGIPIEDMGNTKWE